MQIVKIIFGILFLAVGLYKTIHHLKQYENPRFSNAVRLLSDNGVGFILAAVAATLFRSVEIVLLATAVLYASQKIGLRQVIYLLLGGTGAHVLSGAFAFIKLPVPVAVMIGVALVFFISDREKVFFHISRALLWFGVALGVTAHIKDGLKIVRGSALFEALMNPAGEVVSYLYGVVLSSVTMSHSAAIGSSIVLYVSERLSLEQAMRTSIGGGVGFVVIPLLIALVVNRRAALVFLIFMAIKLISLILGVFMLDMNVSFASHFAELIKARETGPAIIAGHVVITGLVTVFLLLPLPVIHNIREWRKRRAEKAEFQL